MRLHRTLTPELFSQLLTWLGPCAESGGLKFEGIRRRLIHFFVIRGCNEPELLADETIDRVSSKVATLKETYVGDPTWYFLGVASKVFLEWTRDQRRLGQAVPLIDTLTPEDEQAFVCLDKCLEELSDQSRSLIIAYYTSDDTDQIAKRKLLAQRLGISLGALHIRASRIRAKLAECVTNRLDEDGRKVS